MAAPNLASHWIEVHGGSGEVMNQKVMDGPETLLDTKISSDFSTDPAFQPDIPVV